MIRHWPIFLLALVLCCGSCSDDSCTDNGSSLPLATFYIGDSQQAISGLSIMGVGAPGDSLLADGASINEAYLPLRASATSTSYALWRTSADSTVIVRDTVTLTYQPVEYFHSTECGAMYNFEIQDASHTAHGIDSVVVLTPTVTNSRTPAMRIHFKDLTL